VSETSRIDPSAVGAPLDDPRVHRAVLESSQDLIVTLDLGGRITYASPSWQRLGHRTDDLLGRHALDLVHPDDLEGAGAALAIVTTGESLEAIPLRVRRADGTYADVEAAGTPLVGDDGAVTGLVGTARDVSERLALRGRLAELGVVNRLADAVTRARTLDDLLQEAVTAIIEGVGTSRASVLLADAEGVMRFRAWSGLSDEYRRATDGHSPWPVDAVDPQPVLVADVAHGGFDTELEAVIRREGIGAVAFIPLVHDGRLLGKFMLYEDEPHEWTEAEIRLCRTISNHLGSSAARFRARGELRASHRRFELLARASALLSVSLDVDRTLDTIAALVVPELASYCVVDLVRDGAVVTVAMDHEEPEKAAALRRLRAARPASSEGHPVQHVIASGETMFRPSIADASLDDPAHESDFGEALRALGPRSAVVVPLVARGHILGALSAGTTDGRPRLDPADVGLFEELGRRAAVAVDNAFLHLEMRRAREEAEGRAHAAEALEFVGDAVALVDTRGVVRLWNPAAAAITLVPAEDVLGRRVEERLPGLAAALVQVPLQPAPPGESRVRTLPVDVGGTERWVSISGVRFLGGTVYAFRDVSEERFVERLKSDFVSTVSHELRTPLAAVFGAAQTLRRADLSLDAPQRDALLEMIAGEADRLARIVEDILLASRLDAGTVTLEVEQVDAAQVAEQVVGAARSYAPDTVALALEVEEGVPPVDVDRDKIRQVLANLVENAIKYSPDGGRVLLGVARDGDRVRFTVTDEGLGIPPGEHGRIWEKFYRLDPNLTRGVGGTGLGLYICRELVGQMDGRIWVESTGVGGSTFAVEFAAAG